VHIIISYRSTDSTAAAADIGAKLAACYGKDLVHMDQMANGAPEPSLEAILVVVIGPRWLGPFFAGRPAIHDVADPVRCQIELALRNSLPIVPVTVDGSRSPRAVDLPKSIQDLVSRQAVELRAGRDFSQSMERLKAAIDLHLPRKPGPDLVPAPTSPPILTRALPPTGSHPVLAEAAAEMQRASSADNSSCLDRSTAEYWMHHAAAERGLAAGDAPLVVVSYASEDLPWVDDLQAFIDPRIEQLRDPGGQLYELWQFSDARRGTSPGDAFPTVVAEKMWRCRAALILLSKAYFNSRYCRQIELPFLMWRREHHQLFCMPIRLGAVPSDRIRLPAYLTPSRSVYIDELIDERQAPVDFASSSHRDLTLKQLKERGYESEIESRFSGVARLIADHLKKNHGAIED
jgi:hypothetical protein